LEERNDDQINVQAEVAELRQVAMVRSKVAAKVGWVPSAPVVTGVSRTGRVIIQPEKIRDELYGGEESESE